MIWTTDQAFDPWPLNQTWPRYCQDDRSEQVWWRLDQNCGLKSVHKIFLWFDLLTYFFLHDPYSNLTEIMSRWSFWASLMKNGPKTFASNECSQSFFYDYTYWLTFWPDMTHIQTLPRYCQDVNSEQVQWWLDQKLWLLESSQEKFTHGLPTTTPDIARSQKLTMTFGQVSLKGEIFLTGCISFFAWLFFIA